MKKNTFIFLLTALLFTSLNFAQEHEMVEVPLNENSVIKDVEGKTITFSKLMTLMETGDWTVESKKDNSGLDYFQARKMTTEDKAMMAEFMAKSAPPPGTPAPEFNFEDMNGNSISTANTQGKVVVLNFWFTTCKPCIIELPELNELYEKYKTNENIVFASVTFESQEKVNAFLKKRELLYPVVTDQGEVSQAFTNGSYPTNVVIGKDGTYHSAMTGGFPNIGKEIEKSIEAALAK